MFRSSFALFLLILALSDFGATATAAEELPAYVRSPYRGRVSAWLGRNAEFRIAMDADCACTEDIANQRTGGGAWPPNSMFHPYFVVGDFAGDGAVDVAVGVVAHSAPKQFRVLILHGASTKGTKRADFLSEPFPLSNNGIFYGEPRPKPWRLIVGAFAAEGQVFVPQSRGYTLEDGEEG